ncbi:MAG: DUF3793 family protein [Oscillospiraceae bacterium]|nr:DUF3793 family protein [Oscillospiraceae bacterium]
MIMCRKVGVDDMSSREYSDFERRLAFHTAPSLIGIKSASLMSLRRGEFDVSAGARRFNVRAAAKGLKIKVMCGCGERVLLLVYREDKLCRRLSDPACREVLRSCGYTDDMTAAQCIGRLAQRLEADTDFPHEIGIFLDYPVEDVVGFIRNGGCNFKLCGYWKVYGSVEKAKRTFENYNRCRRFLCTRLDEGDDLCRALKIC